MTLSPYLLVKQDIPMCDPLDMFSCSLESEICLELHDVILKKNHPNTVYTIVISVIRQEKTQESQTQPEDDPEKSFAVKSSFRPFFNKDFFPFCQKIPLESEDDNHGLFFAFFLRSESSILEILEDTNAYEKMNKFDLHPAFFKPIYYSFMPLTLENGSVLQGKFSLPIYNYLDGVADSILG